MDKMDWKEKILLSLLGLSYLAMKQAERQHRKRKNMFVVLSFLLGFVLVLFFFLKPTQEKGDCAINFHLCYKALLIL